MSLLNSKQNKTLIAAFILSLFTGYSTWAGNSAGARGGGTGILCAKEDAPVTLEEFQLTQQSSTQLFGPESASPEDLHAYIKEKFKRNELFLEKVETILEANGSYDSWPSLSDSTINSNQLDISSFFRKMLTENGLKPDPASDWTFVNDDFGDIPVGCHKVQLSMLLDGAPQKVDSRKISETTKRVLELHEALYMLGMQDYQHQLPILTRKTIVTLFTGNDLAIDNVLNTFISVPERTVYYNSEKSIYFLHDVPKITKAGIVQCPAALSFAYDGESDLKVISLEVQKNYFNGSSSFKVSVKHPFTGVQKTLVAYQPVLRFNGDEAFFPNSNSTFSPQIGDAEQVSLSFDSFSCSYTKWTPKNKLDESTVVKIWNSLVLNQK